MIVKICVKIYQIAGSSRTDKIEKKCWLKTSDSGRVKIWGHISGPKNSDFENKRERSSSSLDSEKEADSSTSNEINKENDEVAEVNKYNEELKKMTQKISQQKALTDLDPNLMGWNKPTAAK